MIPGSMSHLPHSSMMYNGRWILKRSTDPDNSTGRSSLHWRRKLVPDTSAMLYIRTRTLSDNGILIRWPAPAQRSISADSDFKIILRLYEITAMLVRDSTSTLYGTDDRKTTQNDKGRDVIFISSSSRADSLTGPSYRWDVSLQPR